MVCIRRILLFLLLALPSVALAAFPTIRSSATSSNSNTSTHSITLPATVESGDLLLVVFGVDGFTTVTWDDVTEGTWTLITTSGGGDVQIHVYAKVADGTEDSATLAPTTSNGQKSAHASYAIQDWEGTLSGVEGGSDTGTSTTPDPPNLAPTFGSGDTLWFAFMVADEASNTISSYPSGYTSNQIDVAPDTFSGSVRLGGASKNAAASSDNPGTYSISGSTLWRASTVAVEQGAGSSTALPIFQTHQFRTQ